jgi:hypothetical protein
MRHEITTLEIAKLYKRQHKYVLDMVRRVIERDLNYKILFKEFFYTNTRGREYPAYLMELDGFCILSEHSTILTGCEKGVILKEFGQDIVVVPSKRTRTEDIFYGMLCEFLPHLTIIRQFPVNGYRVDFYIEGAGLFVEFDEEQHFSEKHKKADDERWYAINNYLAERDGYTPNLIRVKKGCEIYGLSLIMSFLALNSFSAIEATCVIETNDAKYGAVFIAGEDRYGEIIYDKQHNELTSLIQSV